MSFFRKDISTPFGKMCLVSEDDYIILVEFVKERLDRVERFMERIGIDGFSPGTNQAIEHCEKQLGEYFAAARESFDVDVKLYGTPFQIKVWRALCNIPYGETISYKQLAERIDSPKGFRAVGMANNRNPISVIIPCHRVVGSDKALVGYGGGLEVKQALLELEQKKGAK